MVAFTRYQYVVPAVAAWSEQLVVFAASVATDLAQRQAEFELPIVVR